MQQIFINLIQNALSAGGTGVHIRIEATPVRSSDWPPLAVAEAVASGHAQVLGVPADAARAVMIRICDDGPGISADRISQVFDPFFTTREPGEGTGLGLYIVAEIVQEQGGGIAVSNRADGGACFHLWLPCGAEA